MAKTRLSCQSGVFSVLGAVTLLLALVSLVLALDSGRLYMEQRKLQKLADTAALETVARLDDPSCGKNDLNGVVEAFAKQNAQLNGFSPEIISAECVSVTPTIDKETKIADGTNTAVVDPSGNAVQTVATETVPASLILRTGKAFGFDFGSSVTLQAKAVAERSSEPTAVFSIGAQLLRLNNNKLIGSLLRDIGLTPEELRILDSDGVATASITPSGLLKELGVELSIHELKTLSPEELASLSELEVVTIAELIGASIKLVNGDDTLNNDLALFNEGIIGSELNNVNINLFSTTDKPGLLSLASSRDDGVGSALDARLNLSEVLGTAILIGANKRALHLSELDILGLTKAELGIVEPPSLAVGPVGTMAYNAQIRLYVNIGSKQSLLGPVIPINLPLILDLTTAKATVSEIQCTSHYPSADFIVESSILNACIGEVDNDIKWSSNLECSSNVEEFKLSSLTGSSTKPLHLEIKNNNTNNTVTNIKNSTLPTYIPENKKISYIKELLDILTNILPSLLTDLIKNIGGPLGLITPGIGGILGPILDVVNNIVGTLLNPVISTIDAILSELLINVLGIELGVSELAVHDINCGAPRLVSMGSGE